MIFWDSSALVALLVTESESAARRSQFQADPEMIVWWATPVEIESALQLRLREGSLDADGARLARDRWSDLAAAWHEVNPVPAIRKLALRLLRTHPLRAADSLQLAAALSAHKRQREGRQIVHQSCVAASGLRQAAPGGLQAHPPEGGQTGSPLRTR